VSAARKAVFFCEAVKNFSIAGNLYSWWAPAILKSLKGEFCRAEQESEAVARAKVFEVLRGNR